MWYDLYKQKRLSIILEISTYCNAKCPQCSRIDPNGLGVNNKFTPNLNMTLSEFKHYFPPEVLSRLFNIHFSGTFGDPLMNPDILEIIKYIISTDDRCWVSINTNGSLRNEDFWWDLGSIGRRRLKVIFDIDGINQEMHEKYRRGTSLKKILKNMDVLKYTPAKIHTFTVLFKHNQDFKDEIETLCRSHGSTECEMLQSNRFTDSPIFTFINEKGETETLEQVSDKTLLSVDINRNYRRVRDYRFKEDHKKIKDFIRKKENNIKQIPEINCVFLMSKQLHIDVSGIVYPCCYWEFSDPESNTMYNKFRNNLSKNDLKKYSFEDILSNEYFNNGIYESFKDKDLISNKCIFMCRKI